MTTFYKLWQRVLNGGDGSATIYTEENENVAYDKDEEHNEEGEGWAEPSVCSLNLKLEGGKLYYLDGYNGLHMEPCWVEVPAVNNEKDAASLWNL